MTDENIDQEKVQAQQNEQDDTEYPPLKKLLPIMVAIWLAFFVVALVSIVQRPPSILLC